MRTVLAEDDPLMQTVLAAALRQCHHEVLVTSDGVSAWQAIAEARPELAVLDWQMPGLDGIEVCRRLRALDPRAHTFVLMVTGRESGEDLAEALDAGVDDYLVKPIAPESFRARIRIAESRIAKENARRRAEDELARARWLAGIGETALALQHEVNNPLASLLNHAELAGMDERAPEEVLALIRVIIAEAQRVARVVRRLAALEQPTSVDYLGGRLMIDLSGK